MNKNCARCTKIVYPIEELKCLDKTWHKTCFKCHECGMTLNMKTYKGFNKLPYCEAHIPKAKATAIADTPELKRIAENTKIQSNVQYHADFEKQKGKLTQVADDPETLRIKQNTKHISNVAYHGDLAKKAAMEKQREVAEVSENRDNESEYFSETLAAESLSQYQSSSSPPLPPPTTTTNHTSQKHHNSQPPQQQQQPQHHSSGMQNSQIYSSQNSQPQQQQLQQQQQYAQQQQQQKYQAQPTPQNNHHNSTNYQSQSYPQQQQQPQPAQNIRSTILQSSVNPSGANVVNNQLSHQQQLQQKYYDQYENYARPSSQNIPVYNNNHNNNNNINNQPQTVYTNNQSAAHQQPPYGYQNNVGGGYSNPNTNNHYNHQQLHYNEHSSGNGVVGGGSGGGGGGGGSIGKISDYDPLTDGPRNIPNATRPSSTLIFSSDRGMVNNQQPRRIGSIADIDPANGVYGSIEHNNAQNLYHQQSQQAARLSQQQQQQQHQQQQQQHHQKQYASQPQQPQQMQKSINSSKIRVFRALYDYEAQDLDEVSFAEGDVIFEVDSIDAGWMTGRVERTGKTGMLPANYVEPAII